VIPQFVQLPSKNMAVPDPPLVKVDFSVVPEMTYTSLLFAVQIVWPLSEFEAHALTALGVGICVGVMLLPSMFTTLTFGIGQIHAPFGTYAITFLPRINADSEFDAWHEPWDKSSPNTVVIDTMQINKTVSNADIRQNVQHAINRLKAILRAAPRTIALGFIFDPGVKGVLPQFILNSGNIVSPPCETYTRLFVILVFHECLSTRVP